MKRNVINPWNWQEPYGFVQANELSRPEHMVFCAGQTSVDPEGKPVHEGDMLAQIHQSLDNLETVLEQAGMNLSNVVRLNYYTTDVDKFIEANDVLARRLKQANCQPASTLLGVAHLAFPALLVELEATAVM